MKVLFAALHVPSGRRAIGGVQSWIKTLRSECERYGHECAEWEPGMPEPEERFDFGIFSNMVRTHRMLSKCEKTICVSHGIVKDEAPGNGADSYFFTSEAVRDHWGTEGAILRQPIDLNFWKPSGGERNGAICYSYRGEAEHCRGVAEALGMPYERVHDVSHEVARDRLSRAELVFASGRAALEAMACGARVVIYDHRIQYQPPYLGVNLHHQMCYNYSGRGSLSNPTFGEVLAVASDSVPNREWVETHHDSEKIAQHLLSAYDD